MQYLEYKPFSGLKNAIGKWTNIKLSKVQSLMYGGNTSTFKNAKQDVIKHQKRLKEKVVENLPHFDMRRNLKMQTFT